MHRDQDGWKAEFMNRGAYWEHNEDPVRPHALLTSGKHSNGFFNSKLVIADHALLAEAAADLLRKLAPVSGLESYTDIVAGPQTGATALAQHLARRIGCDAISPGKGENESDILTFEDRQKVRHKTVLLCEDVITTGGSVERSAKAIKDAGGKVAMIVLALVNRSGQRKVDGRIVVSLIERDLPIWEPDGCPLCKAGSEAIRPKDNWPLLVSQIQAA